MQSTRLHRGKRSRTVGRPSVQSDEDVRNALLDAATRLFLKQGFERVTARQIAAAAGAAPAMINYYFTNKLGLFRAMLERAIQPVRAMLTDALAGSSTTSLDAPRLMSLQMRTLATNPWIGAFIVNEVLAEQGRFRTTFIRDFASRHAPLIIELIERGKANGRFHPDLDSSFAALSLLSLCLFPFIARPIVEAVFGLKYQGAGLDRLIAHSARLFIRGIEQQRKE